MRALVKVVLIGAAVGLSGCIQSRLHLSDDYGRAVRQNTVAQVDDPDAKYVGIPDGGSHGLRVGLAQDRYKTGKVTPPASTQTSTVAGGGGSPSQ
jgi:hypothetical protein